MIHKALLMILDGWGIGDKSKGDIIYSTPTPFLDKLYASYPNAQLQASGSFVGLPDGQMGNSEVGHLNIGAGRIVYQDLLKINRACEDNSLATNEVIQNAIEHAHQNGSDIHLLGLVSAGGVHSSLEHLKTLCRILGQNDCKHYVHCFMDGRDTDPKSGKGYVAQLEECLVQTGGKVASVIGRYYAMDRDNNWDRIKIAYDLLISGIGKEATSATHAIEQSYNDGVTDEFIKPISLNVATIKPNDVVIFFNYRNDRAKELTIALSQPELLKERLAAKGFDPNMLTTLPLYYCCMTPYDDKFKGVHILFDKENVENTLGQTVSEAGLKQLHIAETEKYAHVTFFINGGRELPFENEDRILVPSPKVATYDLQPEMSAYEVADKLSQALNSQIYDLAIVNFANGDMVGHTGVYEAIEKAVATIDKCVEQVITAAQSNGYDALIIADHGNADYALNSDGTANTAHSTNPVPVILVSERFNTIQNGCLADVAPTILEMMALQKPAAMSGKSLIKG